MTIVKTDSAVSPKVKAFLENFYRLSDEPSAHEEYSQQFIDGSGLHFQIGPMKAVDTRKDVHAWRVKAWQPPIISRNHQIDDVFVKGDEQLMLRGRVTYGKDDGSEGSATCGAWMVFAPGEELKIQSYTVWVTPEQK